MLTPNTTFYMNGVLIREKIIPDGTKWTNAGMAAAAGFKKGNLYKEQRDMKPQFVTIHNTDDLNNVLDDGEQYTRATYNEAMGSTRVHFYVDETGAWQNLRAGTLLTKNDMKLTAEMGWHSGDGTDDPDDGNCVSLALELIMNDNAANDEKTYDNGARIAAWLLYKHNLPIDALVTHTYWVNKAAGRVYDDPDIQSCSVLYGKKWCPTYIFKSYNLDTAMKNWKAFKSKVNSYLNKLKNPTKTKKLYRVQIGAFSSQKNAKNYLVEAQKKGFSGFVFNVSSKLYRVQIGSFSSKTNATRYLNEAKKAGFTGFIVEYNQTIPA